MSAVIIAGGTGMVGKHLTSLLLEKGKKVIILSRSPGKKSGGPNLSYAGWNPSAGFIDESLLKEADCIINLAGANVMAQRWSAAYKKEIEESRTSSSGLLAAYIKKNPGRIKSFISSSAIGWYGPDKSHEHFFTEEEVADKGFLGETCRKWEESVLAAAGQTRVVILRTGIVLGKEEGFFKAFDLPLRMGIAPIPGNGKQILSWIHINDLANMFLFAIENANVEGSYNATAPHPESLKDITLAYAKKKRGSFFIPIHAPGFALRIVLGERSVEILKSTRVSSEKIRKAGFHFGFPNINEAISDLCK